MKKKILSILSVMLIVITMMFTLSISASAAENPYITSQTIDGVTTIPCTWYAWQQAHDNLGVELPLFGHAYQWYDNAIAHGYSVGSVAKPQSIAVWQGGSHGLGHVAYVVSVNGSKMYVNEGGMTINGAAANGTGIVKNNTCNSTVGTYKESGSSQKLKGFIYLTESSNPTGNVIIDNYNSNHSNVVTETDATVHGLITKPSSYPVTQLGIRIRKANGSYENGWSYYHAPSQSYVGETKVHPWYEMNSEVKLTLTHQTTYNYQFYAKINGVDYWSAEAMLTTKGTHSYGSWQTVASATCTTNGSQKRTCACGDIQTQSVGALGHNFSSTFTVDKAATCTVQGTKSKHCTRCSSTTEVTAIPAKGHSYGDWDTTSSPTCTATGSQKHTCSTCGYIEHKTLTALGHNYSSSWTVDKAATCTVQGTKSKHCTRCSAKTNITTITANGHSWSDWSVSKQATYESTGLKLRKCTTKGCSAEESAVIAKLSADGHTHKFSEWKTQTSASCAKDGEQKRECSICKADETRIISAKGHAFGEWIVEKAATCENVGTQKRSCAECHQEETLTMPALGHSFSEWQTKSQATDDADGLLERKCSVCGKTEMQNIPKLNSNDDSQNVDAPSEAKTDKESGLKIVIIVCTLIIATLLGAMIVLILIKKKK